MAEEKVDLTENSVAYFDQGVEAPGFYLLVGEPTESEVHVTEGDQLYDEEGNPAVDERGRMAVGTADGEGGYELTTKKTGEVLTVKSESTMTPGQRVYPSPDGDGFVLENPNPEDGEN